MTLGDIILNYRNSFAPKMSQRDFAKKCGLSHTYIAALEKNIDPRTGKPIAPTLDTVKYISKGMGLSVEEILKILDDEQEFTVNEDLSEDNLFNNDKQQVLPLLGSVKAGYDYFAQQNWIGWISIDKKVSNPDEYYALRVAGDSMQPILYEDDIVVVHKQNDLESGQVGIILIDGEEATIKKVIKHDDCIKLIAFNSYYPPKKLYKKDNFKIIGKVIEGRVSKIFE